MGLIEYFDIRKVKTATGTLELRKVGQDDKLPWLWQYLAAVLGIIVKPFLDYYLETGGWLPEGMSFWGQVLFGLIMGMLIFPAIYRSEFDPKNPGFFQFCTLFAAGFGWQSLIDMGAKGIGRITGLIPPIS